MTFYLASIMSAFFLAFISYQPALAGANTFTAKSIHAGDNLLSILREHGFTESEREKVLAADSGLRQLFLTLDTQFLVRRTAQETELRMFDSQTSAAFRILKNKSSLIAHRYEPQFKVTSKRVEGRVFGGTNAILGCVLAQIKSNWVASRFVDAYAFDIKNSKSIAKGARFWFTVEKKYAQGEFIKYGEVLYTSLEIEGQAVHKKFIRSKDGGIFFNSQELFSQRPLYAPVGYLKIASRFRLNRLHPITGRRQPHLGIDFELPTGEPVYSPNKGVVLRYGRNRAAGNYIVLLHSNGMQTSFNHLHRIEKRIRQGQMISAGEKIGEVGCTGYCTRPHLHFAVKSKGLMVDPIRYMKPYPSYMKARLTSKVAQN